MRVLAVAVSITWVDGEGKRIAVLLGWPIFRPMVLVTKRQAELSAMGGEANKIGRTTPGLSMNGRLPWRIMQETRTCPYRRLWSGG